MTVSIDKEPVVRFWNRIDLVADITRLMREKPANRKTLRDMLEMISRVVAFDAASVRLLNARKDELEEAASFGGPVDVLEFLQFEKGLGLAGWAAMQKRPVMIPGRDPETSGARRHHDSILILPLLALDELIGVICFRHHAPDAFEEKQQRLLEIVADQVAIALERIRYRTYQEEKDHSLENIRRELSRAQAGTAAWEKCVAVRDLAAAVNREVNDPLGVIVGNARIIELEASRLPQDITARIEAIVKNARRISLITHKLLKIDRLISENYTGESHETMLNDHHLSGDNA